MLQIDLQRESSKTNVTYLKQIDKIALQDILSSKFHNLNQTFKNTKKKVTRDFNLKNLKEEVKKTNKFNPKIVTAKKLGLYRT